VPYTWCTTTGERKKVQVQLYHKVQLLRYHAYVICPPCNKVTTHYTLRRYICIVRYPPGPGKQQLIATVIPNHVYFAYICIVQLDFVALWGREREDQTKVHICIRGQGNTVSLRYVFAERHGKRDTDTERQINSTHSRRNKRRQVHVKILLHTHMHAC
jgi:hypothetical protein